MIRDFVPYRVTTNGVSRTCLYDRAKGGFYFSKGSTDLIPGPERVIPFDGPVISFDGFKEVDPVRVSVEYEVESLGEGESLTGEVSLVWYGMDLVARTNRLVSAVDSLCVLTNELDLVTGSDLSKSDIVRAFLVLTVSNGRTVTSAEAFSLQRAKCGGGGLLPDGYELLDCVKSANSQYVDTGVYPGANFAIWMRFAQDGVKDKNQALFGAAPDRDNYPPCVRALLRKTGEGSGTDRGSGVGLFELAGDDASKNRMTTDGPKLALGTAIHELFIPNDTKMTLDGSSDGFNLQPNAKGGNPLNVTLTKTLHLFNWNGSASPPPEKFTGRLYGCRIYDGETVVREFVPVQRKVGTDAVEVGLYDLAAKEGGTAFYQASGGTAFVAGEVVPMPPSSLTVAGVKRSSTKAYLTLAPVDLGNCTISAAAGATYGGAVLEDWDVSGLAVTVLSGGSAVRVSGIPAGANYLRLYVVTEDGMISGWSNGQYLPAIRKSGMILIVH